MTSRLLGGGALALALALSLPATAQIAVSGNDNKRRLENGVNRVVPNAPADTITILDLGGRAPRVLGEVALSHSVVGPPTSVAITPDERFAIVTSAERADPADPARMVPDNRVQVVDLRATPPRVTQTIEAGAGPSGVSVNRAGTLALVANRNAGTVSVFRLSNGTLTPVSTVTIGNATASPAHVQFTPDGRRALVTRDDAAASFVSVLNIEGETVTKSDRDITAGLRPYGMGITPDGRWAVAANIGRGGGDNDTVTLINLQREPFLAVDTISVGPTPEGIQVSPDGRHVAVTIHNGSARPQGHPLRGRSQLVMLRIDNGRLREVARAPIGDWAQGVAFSRDGRTLLVQNMADRNIAVFRFQEGRLRDTGTRIAVNGGPAAIRTADVAPPARR
jgi:DNA-binding beta-propeller fold protein YncE